MREDNGDSWPPGSTGSYMWFIASIGLAASPNLLFMIFRNQR